MAKKGLSGVSGVIDNILKIAAEEARTTLASNARAIIGRADERHMSKASSTHGDRVYDNKSFYGSYEPKKYVRIGNLENSFRTFLDRPVVEPFKNSSNRIGHVASLRVSADYMPHDRHLKVSGGGIYPKSLVMNLSYDLGLHVFRDSYNVDSLLGGVVGLNTRTKSHKNKIKKIKGRYRDKRQGFGSRTYRMSPSPGQLMYMYADRMLNNKRRIGELSSLMGDAVLSAIAESFGAIGR